MVQLRGKGCEITEYLLDHLEYAQGCGRTMDPDSFRLILGLARFYPSFEISSCEEADLEPARGLTPSPLYFALSIFSCLTSSFPTAHSTGCRSLLAAHRAPRAAAGSRGRHTVPARTAGRMR